MIMHICRDILHTYIHRPIHTHTHTNSYYYTYIHTHTYTYIYIHTHIRIRTRTHTYIHTYAYTCTLLYIHIHTRSHTYRGRHNYLTDTYISTYSHTYRRFTHIIRRCASTRTNECGVISSDIICIDQSQHKSLATRVVDRVYACGLFYSQRRKLKC